MRLSLLSLLLVTAATPALAADPDPEPQSEAREAPAPRFERAPRAEREAPRESPERFERPERMERPQPALRAERFERPEPAERPARFDPPAAAPAPVRDVAPAAITETGNGDWDRRAERREAPRPSATSESASGWRERTGERRTRNRDVPPAAGSPVFGSAIPDAGNVTTPRREVSAQDVAAGSLRGRIAAEGLRRDRIERDRRDRENWSRDWRQDRRYDWRRHRDRDRSRFHVGIYIDPFGWGYRDWDLGWQLPSRFYSAGYWINDPWSYRLPPVSGPYRWVRYYDDVLLVDLRTGRVLDRIRNFFW